MKPKVLACPPVDAAKQAQIGIVAFTPGPGSEETLCERCGAKVWIGPKLRELRNQQSATVVCFQCALPSGGTVQSLGGTGGSYLVDRRLLTKR